MELEDIYKGFHSTEWYKFSKDTYKDEAAYLELVASRARMLTKEPFFGVVSMSLVLVETPHISTMGVDGFHLFYNPKFVMKLRREERDFAVAHEVLHVVAKHCFMTRIKDRDPLLWNYAIDFITNYQLVQHGFTLITTVPILYDEQYAEMSAEEIYEHLKTNKPPSGRSFDIHSFRGEEDSGIGLPGEEVTKRLDELEDIFAQAAAAQHQAEQSGRVASSGLAGLYRALGDLKEARVNWRDILRYYVTQISAAGYSYATPNKALFNMGYTLPGFRKYEDAIDLAVAIDLSASVTREQAVEFFSELKAILYSASNINIWIWCFDGDVDEANAVLLTRENIDEFEMFTPRGGGGTIFESNWEYMKRMGIRPRLFIMLTDGLPNEGWGEDGYCPTMFLINCHPGTTRPVPPFGIPAYYDDYRNG